MPAARAPRIGKTIVGTFAAAALVGGMSWAQAAPADAAVGGNQPRLTKGDRGSKVVRLQRELSAYGPNVPDTGYFGPITKSRVNNLKANRGMRTDGIAGHRVWKVLFTDGHKVNPVKKKRSSGTSRSHSRPSIGSGGSSKAKQALAYAKNQIGDSYSYGASGPNAFDCSGLTMAAYKSAGISLPHNTVAQYQQERKVSKSNLKKGDLVFFYSGRSHVGIYAGNGRIVHAANSSSPVEYSKVSYMPFNGAVRPA